MFITPINHRYKPYAQQTTRNSAPCKTMASSQNDSVNFGKTLCATTKVFNIRQKQGENVNFQEYDYYNRSDKAAIEDIQNSWRDSAPYMPGIAMIFNHNTDSNIKKYAKDKKTYTLETSDEEILAAARTQTISAKGEKVLKIDYLQADPNHTYDSSTRNYKGIGSALLAKIVETAAQQDISRVILQSGNDLFWDTMPFFQKHNDPIIKDQFVYILNKDCFQPFCEDIDNRMNEKIKATWS